MLCQDQLNTKISVIAICCGAVSLQVSISTGKTTARQSHFVKINQKTLSNDKKVTHRFGIRANLIHDCT